MSGVEESAVGRAATNAVDGWRYGGGGGGGGSDMVVVVVHIWCWSVSKGMCEARLSLQKRRHIRTRYLNPRIAVFRLEPKYVGPSQSGIDLTIYGSVHSPEY